MGNKSNINIKKMSDAEISLLAKVLVWGETRGDANFISKSAIEKRLVEFFHRYVVITRDEQVVLRRALDCAIRERIRDRLRRDPDENQELELREFQEMRLRLRWDEVSEIMHHANQTESECSKALGNGERS